MTLAKTEARPTANGTKIKERDEEFFLEV